MASTTFGGPGFVGCDCECFWVRCWEGTLMCQACGHRRSQHRSIFASDISAPIRQFGFLDSGKTALASLWKFLTSVV